MLWLLGHLYLWDQQKFEHSLDWLNTDEQPIII